MTIIGAGGVAISRWRKSKRFHRDYDNLTTDMRDKVDQKLQDLTCNPRPSGLAFEKLKGHSNPDIYTIHVTGNYKISFEVTGTEVFLRRCANHDEIDRAP